MGPEIPDPGRGKILRPGSGRYFLLGIFWIFWGWVVFSGVSRLPSRALEVKVLGPAVVDEDQVRGWVAALPFRTMPSLDRATLDRFRRNHRWIESVSEKHLPGLGRIVRVKVWEPVALLRPAYGLMAFQAPVPMAHPSRVSYLNDQGLSLRGDAYGGTGNLPQVIVRFPLTQPIGRRLVRTIQTVKACHSSGAPSGQWYSLNGPHEIRFYPGHNLPILLLGTDLGCAPFELFRRLMAHSGKLLPGQLPEGIDLRFSGMILLRPTLDNHAPPPPSTSPMKSIRS